MWVKIHTSAGSRKIIAICDKDLLGKKVEEGRLQLDINEHFYKGEKKTKKEIVPLLKGSFILNLVGEGAVALGIELGLVDKLHVLYIKGIPHAQAVVE